MTATTQNGKGTTLQSQAIVKQKNDALILTPHVEEIKQKPTLAQVFQKINEGQGLQEYHEKTVTRLKEITDFHRKAKEGAGLIFKGFLPSGESIEFGHINSNLEYLHLQEERGREHLKKLEDDIQSFSIN